MRHAEYGGAPEVSGKKMNSLEAFATAIFIIQIAHSIEELSSGFHKKWYLFKMPFWVFLTFEICFTAFWAFVLFIPQFPNRSSLLYFFIALMFANGLQHIIWWCFVKKYVPGLITAPIHVLLPLVFYLR
jgi:hypothetical protein